MKAIFNATQKTKHEDPKEERNKNSTVPWGGKCATRNWVFHQRHHHHHQTRQQKYHITVNKDYHTRRRTNSGRNLWITSDGFKTVQILHHLQNSFQELRPANGNGSLNQKLLLIFVKFAPYYNFNGITRIWKMRRPAACLNYASL